MTKYLDNPCPNCGWKFPGFHICLALPLEVMRRPEDGSTVSARKVSPAKAISNRNAEIIHLYNVDELTMVEIATKLGIPGTIVMNVLHTAQENGDVVIRRAARRTARY